MKLNLKIIFYIYDMSNMNRRVSQPSFNPAPCRGQVQARGEAANIESGGTIHEQQSNQSINK